MSLMRPTIICVAFIAMEALRAPLTVFPLLNQHFSSIGVPLPEDVSGWGAITWGVWLLWLVIVVTCIVVVTDLTEYKYGRNWSSVLRSAALVWAATFGITWLSMFNLGLANADVLLVALPGSLIEMVVLCWVAQKWKQGPR